MAAKCLAGRRLLIHLANGKVNFTLGDKISSLPGAKLGTKGALVHKFLPLKLPCSVHDAARRASVALARGERAVFYIFAGILVSWRRKLSPFAFQPATKAACRTSPTVEVLTSALGITGR